MAESAVVSLITNVLGELGSYAADKFQSAYLAKNDLQKLERSLEMIRPFIRDAEKRQSGSNTIKQWVKELKQVVYNIDDLLDEASTDARRLKLLKRSSKVRYYLSYAKHKLISPFSLSDKIKEIFYCLDDIKARTSSLNLIVNVSEPVPVPQISDRIKYPLPNISRSNNIKGRDETKREILGKVLSNNVDCCYGLSVLPIVGIGGLGKTTLAQLVYSDPAIEENFDIKLWGCVSDPFKLETVLSRILESVNIGGLTGGQMVQKLGSIVRGKRYFMVLDDVWTRNANEWNGLKEILAYGGADGSVILVTTRDRGVATKTIGAKNYYDLEKLPSHLCMSVFLENAFMEGEHERYPGLVKVGEDIVAKCGGVPLALKTLGSSLRGQRDEKEWQRVAKSDLWNIEQKKKGDILPALKLSYDALDSQLKSCFAYLSIFPKDTKIYSNRIINMWIAHGFIKHDNSKHGDLEGIGYKYVEELSSRSLLEVSADNIGANKVREFKMHDLVHDLATHMMGEELGLVSCDNPNVSRFVKHLAWDEDHDLSCEELPKQLTFQTQQVRTFTWRDNVAWRPVNIKFIKQVILTFKCLRYLCIRDSDIEEIPDSIGKLKHLRFLDLSDCKRIKALPLSICKLLNLQALGLAGCHQLEKLPIDMGKLINLRYLSLMVQSEYMFPKGMRGFGDLPSLRVLRIVNCGNLISLFPEEEDVDIFEKIKFPTQLRELLVGNCPRLSSLLSNGLVYLTSLVELHILFCGSLDWQVELQPKLGGKMPMGLHNLETLDIRGVPKLVGLPDALKSAAPSLRHLLIYYCMGLTSLPDWMRSCKSLNVLDIGYCPNLSSTLPAEVLTTLQRLIIKGCPNLSLGCEEDIIEDLLACEEDSIKGRCPLVSHIPYVRIGGINGREDVFWKDGIRK